MPVRRLLSLIAVVIAAAGVTVGLGAGLALFVPVSILTILVPFLLGAALFVCGSAERRVRRGEAGDG